MARLTQSVRDKIVDKLLKPFKEKERKSVQAIETFLSDLFLLQTPDDIRKIDEKYLGVIQHPSFIYIQSNFGWSIQGISYINVEKYIPAIHQDLLLNLKKDEDFKKLCDKVNRTIREVKVVENKLTCALDHINTENQLKDQFPEAYKVYLELLNTPKENENACDSIENVRALLSNKVK